MWGDQSIRFLGAWKIQLKTLSTAGILIMVGVGSSGQAVLAARLIDWRFDPAVAALEVTLDEGITPRYFLLSQPARIVLDLPNTQLGNVETQQTYSGTIRQIRVSQFQEGVTRIVLDVSPEVILEPEQVQLQSLGNRWVLRPLIASTQPSSSAVAQSPDRLPPTFFPTNQTGVVQVPPLNRNTSPANTAVPATQLPNTVLPPAIFPSNSAVSVEVPPLQSSTPVNNSSLRERGRQRERGREEERRRQGERERRATNNVAARESRPSRVGRVVEFGEPLPTKAETVVTSARVVPSFQEKQPNRETELRPINPNILIAAGTQLVLRYPGSEVLALSADTPRQEVLLLEEEIRDRNGRLIAPVGTAVIGRFETTRGSSRFITQAISLNGQNIPLTALSAPLNSERKVSENRIVRNSALGSLAGILLGGLPGLLGGAAAAAATTYLTAPQPTTIFPNQVLEVQLMEDWQ